MYKIGFDVMGSDKGSKVALEAGFSFLSKKDNLFIYFVGIEKELEKNIADLNPKIGKDRYEIINATEVIDMHGTILDVRRKKDSSLIRTIELLKDKKIDAVVTGGNSAAFIAGAHLLIGEMNGVTRPAFMPTMPSIIKGKTTLLLDAGANGENDANDLYTFAKIASIYSREVLGVEKPLVGLMNIGTEEHKGNKLQRDAYKLISEDKEINFYGNIESREMTTGIVDVLVADGYSGNIALKSMEGMGKNLLNELKKSLTKNIFRKICALMLIKSFSEIKSNFDYKNYAGAILLGIDGIVFKSHGSSDVQSFESTLRMTFDAIENDVVNKIKKGLK